MVGAIAQPIGFLEHKSIITAKYNQPFFVGIYVMSLVHTLFIFSILKFWLSKFGLAIALGSLIVLFGLYFCLILEYILLVFIILAIVFFEQIFPLFFKSCVILGLP